MDRISRFRFSALTCMVVGLLGWAPAKSQEPLNRSAGLETSNRRDRRDSHLHSSRFQFLGNDWGTTCFAKSPSANISPSFLMVALFAIGPPLLDHSSPNIGMGFA
jgi:hypothetical protein